MSKVRMTLRVDGNCYRGKDVSVILKNYRKDYGVPEPDRTPPRWQQCAEVVRALRTLGCRMQLRVWRVKQREDGREYLAMLHDYGVGHDIRRARVRPPVGSGLGSIYQTPEVYRTPTGRLRIRPPQPPAPTPAQPSPARTVQGAMGQGLSYQTWDQVASLTQPGGIFYPASGRIGGTDDGSSNG